jgi:hypothetical protein
MKTTFALLDENGKILKTSDSATHIVYYQDQLKNRRTGKSTRTIFTALGSDINVYILYPTLEMARCQYENVLYYLDNIEFEYTASLMQLQIKPKLSALITFTTPEQYMKLTHKISENYIVLRDNV